MYEQAKLSEQPVPPSEGNRKFEEHLGFVYENKRINSVIIINYFYLL